MKTSLLRGKTRGLKNNRLFGGTQMQATHARKVLPCFDEPAFKTPFDITVGHHNSLSAISNMPEYNIQPM